MTGKGAPAPGPMQIAQANMRPTLPKRFYEKAAAVATPEGFGLHLDGRPARTPGRAVLAVASLAVAEAMAAEWNAQGTLIDPATMPLTRLANTAIDGVAPRVAAVIDEIVAYAGSDLLCYRAEEPEGLVARQEARWSPVLAWARHTFGARFILVAGIRHAEQPAESLARLRAAAATPDPLRLAALNLATTLTGSALLALALARGRLTADEAWALAHLDEDWQIERWGADAEASARRALRRRDFDAAALALAATRG